MRLDILLVEKGIVESRSRAKRAIISGQIKVDGRKVLKPSKQVSYDSSIEIIDEPDVPGGYLKLKIIQDRTDLIHQGDIVLDLGSSVGGFLLFAAQIASRVTGIEYSAEFMHRLRTMEKDHGNITVIHGDVFKMPPETMSQDKVDVLLIDITVEPEDSLLVLKRVLPLLKPGGRVLLVLKLFPVSALDPFLNDISGSGLEVQQIIEPDKREVYVVAVRKEDVEAKD